MLPSNRRSQTDQPVKVRPDWIGINNKLMYDVAVPAHNRSAEHTSCFRAGPGSASNGNNALRTLRRMYSKAKADKLIFEVPGFALFKEHGRSLRLNDVAERRLSAVAEQPLMDIIVVMRDTGMRNAREFRMAPKLGATGKVLAVEIQEAMLTTLRARAATLKTTNVEVIQGSEVDPHLPVGAVNLVLVVDVYHELAYPFEVMTRVRESLTPGGRVVFIEYRKEDPSVRIKELHKMSVKQLEMEMSAVGLVRVSTVETLPLQHIVIFEKRN